MRLLEIQYFPSHVYHVYQNVYQNRGGRRWGTRSFREHGRFDDGGMSTQRKTYLVEKALKAAWGAAFRGSGCLA